MSNEDYLSRLESDFQSFRKKFRHGKSHNIPQELKQKVFVGIRRGISLSLLHTKTGLRLVTLKSWKFRYAGEEADVRLLSVKPCSPSGSGENMTLIWPNGLRAEVSLEKTDPALISRLGGCS